MKIFDSHCHVQFPEYEKDRADVLDRAQTAQIGLICIGTDLVDSREASDLAEKNGNVWATVGLHPNNAEELTEESIWKDFEALLSNDRVVAIGEVGLDYYRTTEPEKQERQKMVFKKFLELAIKYNKPIILHCRDGKSGSMGQAYPDMLEILKLYPGVRGVVHSCTASLEEAKQFLDLGFHLGFNGIITFARTYDEVVKFAPLDRILLETDAPYLTPEPYRGQRNEPAHVIEVAKKLSNLRSQSPEEIVTQTTENCKKLFGI